MSNSTPRRHGIRVLLVEDNAVDQKLVRRALSRGAIPCALHVAGDGQEAMDYLKTSLESRSSQCSLPHLVLLDMNLPRLRGEDVLRAMRQHPGLEAIPAVVLTSSIRNEDVNRCYRLGCNSYVQKPFGAAEFVSSVTRLASYWFELAVLPEAAV